MNESATVGGAGDFGRNAVAVHISERLAGPARALLGLYELIAEQAGTALLPGLSDDLERVGLAIRRLNDEVGRLVSGPAGGSEASPDDPAKVRHDLRTPLNAIIGYLELILEEMEAGAAGALAQDFRAMLTAAGELVLHVDSIAALSDPIARAPETLVDVLGLDPRRLQVSMAAAAIPHPAFSGRILVVDDVLANRELLSRRLQREGHTVVTAASGMSALEAAADDGFDLILLDILMPDMNGIEVLARLKSDARSRGVPVIMVSGLADMDAVVRCIEAGADDYLSKPFNPVLLKARINAILEKKQWRDQERRYLARIEAEKQRSDALLHAILPGQIVARLKDGEQVIADRFAAATVLFADIVGFSPMAARIPAGELIARLGAMFGAFDRLAAEHGVEKIKTIGDAYMAASGVPEPVPDHADRMLGLAASMLETLESEPADGGFRIRIGVHTGPVVAGLIGHHRFVYDVWGETVNIASRLESHGIPNRVHLSEATRSALKSDRRMERRGQTEMKGIGAMTTFLLVR